MSDTQGNCYHRRTFGRYGHLKCEDCGAISDPSTGYKWSPFPGTVSVASDDVQQRAAEVIRGELLRPGFTYRTAGANARSAVAALAAANLLADPDTARLRSLGEAVENMKRWGGQPGGFRTGFNACLDAIYRTAGVEQ